jgi:hypothetical protein
MISVILAFFTAIPSITGGVTAFTQAFYNAKVQIIQAKIGGDTEVTKAVVNQAAVEAHESNVRLSTIAGNKILLWVFALYLIPPGIYRAKIYLIDKLVGPGSFNFLWLWPISWEGMTDPLGAGDVAASDHVIISFMFGSATALAIGHMWFSRPGASDR